MHERAKQARLAGLLASLDVAQRFVLGELRKRSEDKQVSTTEFARSHIFMIPLEFALNGFPGSQLHLERRKRLGRVRAVLPATE